MTSYDNFADQYSESIRDDGDYFHRTQIDPYIFQIIGDVKNKTVYDLGCGNGYIARKLAKSGALVFASDASQKLIEIAKNNSEGLPISYSVHDALDFSQYQDKQFDIVVMNMVIDCIQDIPTLFKEISRVLKQGGIFACSLSHIFRPSYPFSEWIKGSIEGEERLFIKVTDYLGNREKKVMSSWDKQTELTFYNHTLGDIINNLSSNNLFMYHIDEPESVGFATDYSTELQQSHHIPTFMIFGAKKLSN